jgi:transcriptional regulator with XRE-family HTH domain
VGARIRTLLRRRGLTQVALADAAGIAAPTLAHYLAGRSAPSAEVASRMARFLGVTVEDLGLRPQRARGPRARPGRINRRVARRALEQLGLTAAALSRKLGVSKQAVSGYLSGAAVPRAPLLRKMARTLGIELDELVVRDETDPEPVR